MTKNKIEYEDVTIVRNEGIGRVYFTVEVETKFTKREAEKFYNYVSLYHIQQTKEKGSQLKW